MPEIPAPAAAASAQPTSPAGGAAPAKPGQPPFGSSPATQPTQNRGHEAAGMQLLGVIVMGLEQAIPLLGAASEPGRDALKALSTLSKHVPPGAVTPAALKTQLTALLTRAQQQGPQVAQMRAMGGQPPAPAQGAAPAAPAAAAA